MRLFICEKPSLAGTVASFLGKPKKEDGYYSVAGDCVAWLYGHILGLDEPDDYDPALKNFSYDTLPIVPSPFKKHVKGGSSKNAFNVIKKLAKDADEIIHVGDPDREGQYLVDEVLEAIKNKKPTKRLLINAYDDVSVKRAFDSMEDNSSSKLRNQYKAALGRDYTDWLIGMNASRKYSLDSGKTLKVGRVKVPTLALVARRNAEIENFKSIKYYVVRAFFRTDDSTPFESLWQPADDVEGLDSEGRVIDILSVRKVLQQVEGQPGVVKKLEKKKGTKAPRLPFSLSTLQQTCKALSPDKVLAVCQSLYEKKLTTYPRSDAQYIPDSQHADAATIIANLKLTGEDEIKLLADGADSSIKGKAFNSKKVDAHHAIIPTMEKVDFLTLSTDEQLIYKMVAKRYLLQFYPLQEFEDTVCEIDCAGETFIAKGKVVLKPGWTAAAKDEDEETDSKDKDKDIVKESKQLPELHEGDKLVLSVADYTEKNTTPPKPFTQTSLIGAMCNAHQYVKDASLKTKLKDVKGIGTEATRSKIIKELLDAEMLLETGKKSSKILSVSDTVKELIHNLPDELTYPDSTALMEQDLDAVEHGEMSFDDFMQKEIDYVSQLMTLQSNFTKSAKDQPDRPDCPACHVGKLYYKDGKNGRFWYCGEWKKGCNATFSDDNGKPAIYDCPICHNGYLIRYKSKKVENEYYWGCSTHQCKVFFPDVKGKPFIKKCPECKKGYLMKRTGKNGVFWACNAYPDCKATFPDDNGKPGKKEKK